MRFALFYPGVTIEPDADDYTTDRYTSTHKQELKSTACDTSRTKRRVSSTTDTQSTISRDDLTAPGSTTLGLHAWHEQGTIASRGILVDYWEYAERNGKSYDPVQGVGITYEGLMECLAEQERLSGHPIELQKGGILLIRSRYTKRYLELSDEDEQEMAHRYPPVACGINQDVRMLRFLWDKQVTVVGGDAPAWEVLPPNPEAGFLYHELLLAGWGCPIGELLWLEDLARECAKQKRWSFFVASVPSNVPGGVASPANMAVIL